MQQIEANVARYLVRASRLEHPTSSASPIGLDALRGRLVELSGESLGLALLLVREAQLRGEPTAWISSGVADFFPPDVDACGVDLTQLPVLRGRSERFALRAATQLVKTGAFGVVVLDLDRCASLPLSGVARLTRALKRTNALMVCLTGHLKASPLGSMVSLRLFCRVVHPGPEQFELEVKALKDRRRSPGWSWKEARSGSAGLC